MEHTPEKPSRATEELIDTLIAVSVVAKRLAEKLRNEMTGGTRNEQNE